MRLLLIKHLLPKKKRGTSILHIKKAVELAEQLINDVSQQEGSETLRSALNLHDVKKIIEAGLEASSWKKAKMFVQQASELMGEQLNRAFDAFSDEPQPLV